MTECRQYNMYENPVKANIILQRQTILACSPGRNNLRLYKCRHCDNFRPIQLMLKEELWHGEF